MAHLFGLSESANAKIIAKKKLQEIPTGAIIICSLPAISNFIKNYGKSLVWEEKIVGAATIVADSRV